MNNIDIVQINSILTNMKNKVIEARIREEQRLEKYSKMLNSVDRDKLFPGIYIPHELSLKALCPEAYKEFPDEDIYNKEFEELCNIVKPINDKIIEHQKELSECLQQFKMMS